MKRWPPAVTTTASRSGTCQAWADLQSEPCQVHVITATSDSSGLDVTTCGCVAVTAVYASRLCWVELTVPFHCRQFSHVGVAFIVAFTADGVC
jgi:hypothetical protein